jgi:hypothetical protein
MAVKRIKNHGKWVWQARVAYQGRRTSQVCENKDAARTAEGELLRALKAQAGAEEQEAERPATLEEALEGYKANMVIRGKGADSVGNVESTLGCSERSCRISSRSQWGRSRTVTSSLYGMPPGPAAWSMP